MPNPVHRRIDDGVKRGPRNLRRSTPRRRKPNGQISTLIPPDLDPLTVLDQYLTEQTTSQIAQSYGMSRKTLVGWLRDIVPTQWTRVQILRALCRKEDADEELENAPDALSLARAREMLRSGQWDLERLDARNYGSKQEVTHTGPAPVFQVNVINRPIIDVVDSQQIPVAAPRLIDGK